MDLNYFLGVNNLTNESTLKDGELYEIHESIINNTYGYTNVEVDGEETQIIMTATSDYYKYRFVSLPNIPITTGNIISWNGANWIVIESALDSLYYSYGKILQCNNILKFITPQGLIYSTPCVIDNFAGNIESNSLIILEADSYNIIVPLNAYTLNIKVDMRFIFGDINNDTEAFVVTAIDSLNNNYLQGGTLEIKVKKVQKQPNDNLELFIANYDKYKPSLETLDYEIEYISYPNITYGLGYKTFTAIAYDVAGNIIEGVVPIWEISMDNANLLQYISSEINDNIIKLRADNELLIGETIVLKWKDTEDVVLTTLNVGVISIG